MAEEVTETQQATKEVEAQNVETQQEPETQNVRSRRGLWVAIILLVVFMLLFAGFGYYLYQQLDNKLIVQTTKMQTEDQRVIELTKQITSSQSQFTTLQQQLTAASAEASGSDVSYNQKLADFAQRYEDKLDSQHKEQQETILRLQRQLGKTRGDWLLADAEYLLSVANQRLHLMGDLKTTQEALIAADQRLRESGDAAAFKIREQLAKEIAAVKAVKASDMVGNYAILQLLIERIEKLALILPYSGKPLTKSEQVHTHKSKDKHGLLDSALEQVGDLVTVRHLDEPVSKVLSEQEVAFIRQQLSIKVEMVKIALVQEKQDLLAKSIDDTVQWLKAHFTQNNDAQDFMAQLNELKNTSIGGELPDISLSLKMLRDVTKLRIETDKALSEPELVEKTSPQPKITPPVTEVKPPVAEELVAEEAEPVTSTEVKEVSEMPSSNENTSEEVNTEETPPATPASDDVPLDNNSEL